MKITPAPRLALLCILLLGASRGQSLEAGFHTPNNEARPETWFHLISGNVSKPALTTDLEAVKAAGIQGIQLFHGSGRPWPGVEPQIQTLSPTWDSMISHVADETQRLGLRFTMQNCPGWAMSGGPWITPDKAMRHLISSRTDITGGKRLNLDLPKPEPSKEGWRDYRDAAVLAFPTPANDTNQALIPTAIRSNQKELPWTELITGVKDCSVRVDVTKEPTWLELEFTEPTILRSIELPPIEILMARRNFDTDSQIIVQAEQNSEWKELVSREIPRGTWQDRQAEYPFVLAIPDAKARKFRLVFENKHRLELTYLRLFSAARINDWRGQAGYALRSLDRSPTPVQDSASWVTADSIVDLSEHLNTNGQLNWTAPPGQWTILRYGHINTGVKNKPAPPEATGFECDKLSPAGAEQHFAGYIGRLSAPGGPADKGRLQGMLIDSWECFTQTWTPSMEREFAARRGYTLRKWLPALAGYVVGDHLSSERFLRDWRATISDMLVENYFGRLAELARARGMQLSFETAIGDVSPGDILQYHGKADIPMCEFWQPNDPHWGGFEAKPILPTASAAHIYGKPRIAAEAFTNIGHNWSDHPFSFKHLADHHFTLGVNHLVFHTYTHNPLDRLPGTSFGGGIGSPFIRGQTWWKHMPLFTDYIARCQHMLQQGRPVADVLWYLGDDLDHKPRQDSPFPSGYKFDYLNRDVLLNRLQVVDGKLRTPEGVEWKVLWLPQEQCNRLTSVTLKRLHERLNEGALIIGPPPLQNPSLVGGDKADAQFKTLVSSIWGDHTAHAGDRNIGKGRLLWGGQLESHLTQLGIHADLVGTRAATWCHRKSDHADIYFVAADRLAPLDANLTFRATGTPEFWDPMTGITSRVAIYSQGSDGTTIPVRLPASGSSFVIFRPGTSKPSFTKIEHEGTVLLDASDRTHIDQGEPQPNLGLTRREPIQPWVMNPSPSFEILDDQKRFLAWTNGTFSLFRSDGTIESLTVDGTSIRVLDQAWKLSFPEKWDILEEVELPGLKPWSDLDDPAARSFSGTATYKTTLNLEQPQSNQQLLLDLGRVADIAEIRVNGQSVATLWAPPFRANITSHIRAGSNKIEVKVTNTWHNRLAYDASLPPGKRRTWTLSGPPSDSPLVEAGLIGPVAVRVGIIYPLQP